MSSAIQKPVSAHTADHSSSIISDQPNSSRYSMDASCPSPKAEVEDEPKVSMRGGGIIGDCWDAFARELVSCLVSEWSGTGSSWLVRLRRVAPAYAARPDEHDESYPTACAHRPLLIEGDNQSDNAYKTVDGCAKEPFPHARRSAVELQPDFHLEMHDILLPMLWTLFLLPFGIASPANGVTARSATAGTDVKFLYSTVPDANSTGLSNTTLLPRLEPIQHVQTESLLNVAYFDDGPADAQVIVLIHGFPYDINAYVDVAPQLVQKGYRVIVPYLRGFGSTTFLNPGTPRSSEQAALGYDIIALMDALNISQAVFAGYDWGTVAVNVAAALWPKRCTGMVAANSYLIQNRSTAWVPSSPDSEATKWYYYLFLTPRGFAALAQGPLNWARVLWQKNSPQWNFTEAELERTGPALYNSDFTEIAVNFYRIRLLYAPGDPKYAQLADLLDSQPPITVPSVTLDPEYSIVFPPTNGSSTAKYFTGPRVHHIVPNTGENIPQQNPKAFVDAVVEVLGLS